MKSGKKTMQEAELETAVVDDILADPNEFTEAALKFWFEPNEHIRSPFQEYMRDELEKISVVRFVKWLEHINAEAKKDINNEIVAEKFEEILFETALQLAKTDDEKISIRYPFLPRIGDVTRVKEVDEKVAESKLIDRSIEKDGDSSYLKVIFKNTVSGDVWETRFELPE